MFVSGRCYTPHMIVLDVTLHFMAGHCIAYHVHLVSYKALLYNERLSLS